jgi:hypothetical protein
LERSKAIITKISPKTKEQTQKRLEPERSMARKEEITGESTKEKVPVALPGNALVKI